MHPAVTRTSKAKASLPLGGRRMRTEGRIEWIARPTNRCVAYAATVTQVLDEGGIAAEQ